MSFLEIGASLLGGFLSSDAASDAADAQTAGSAAAVAEQRRQFDLTRGDYSQYREVGQNALMQLARYMGLPASSINTQTLEAIKAQLAPQFTTAGTPANLPPGGITYGPNGNSQDQVWSQGTPGSVDQAGLDAAALSQYRGQQQPGEQAPLETIDPTQDPGYQFGLDQGQQALDRKASAAGGRVSGASLKVATRYATDYATTGYGAAYQRGQDRLNRLAALANIGQTATNSSAVAGGNAANAISQLAVNQGNNAGAASIAQGNIWGNAINQGVAAWQRNQPSAGTGFAYQPGVGGLGSGGSPDGYW